MQVKDLMTADPLTITEDVLIKDAAKIMVEKNISVLPVVNAAGKLSGIITASDFVGKETEVPHALASIKELFHQTFFFQDVETLYKNAKETPVGKAMTTSPKTIAPDATLDDLVKYMIKHRLKRVPVVENGNLVGIITRQDLIKAFAAK